MLVRSVDQKYFNYKFIFLNNKLCAKSFLANRTAEAALEAVPSALITLIKSGSLLMSGPPTIIPIFLFKECNRIVFISLAKPFKFTLALMENPTTANHSSEISVIILS